MELDKKTILIIAAAVVALLILILIIVLLVKSSKLKKIKASASKLDERFNEVNSNHIAFKINKVQAMAKKNPDVVSEVDEYTKKYETLQKCLDEIQEKLYNLDDRISSKKVKNIYEDIATINTMIDDAVKQIQDINVFLESFAKREAEQRDLSNRLKDDFRRLKLKIKDYSPRLSISNDGVEVKVKAIEDEFSKSEEALYVQDYGETQDTLDNITNMMKNLNSDINILPGLINDVEGALAVAAEECDKLYRSSKNKGLYLYNLNPDERLNKINKAVEDDRASLRKANPEGIRESIDTTKEEIISLANEINAELVANENARKVLKELETNIDDLKHIVDYVTTNFNDNKEKYGLESLKDLIANVNNDIAKFENTVALTNDDLFKNIKPSSEIERNVLEIYGHSNDDLEAIKKEKEVIEKTAQDEIRAITQVVKLQVALNEIEIKYKEHRLPIIKDNFHEDLKLGKEKIKKVEFMLKQVPIRIDDLNETLNDTITFVYNFCNNTNGIIGTSIMVEKSIVLINKFRSTYPDVDRELNKVEYYFKAGRYTKALEISISCIKKLYPNQPEDLVLKGE